MVVHALTGGRGRDAALAAHQQGHAAVLLQLGHALAGGCQRQPQRARACRQAAGIDHGHIQAQRQQIEAVQVDHSHPPPQTKDGSTRYGCSAAIRPARMRRYKENMETSMNRRIVLQAAGLAAAALLGARSEEHTSELQSPCNLVCRLLLEKKKYKPTFTIAVNSSPSMMRQPVRMLTACTSSAMTLAIISSGAGMQGCMTSSSVP